MAPIRPMRHLCPCQMDEGPRAGFEAFYRRYYERILAYALRRVAPEEAEDVVADTFLTALRRFDELPEDPLPWLFGVARRVIANYRRSSRRRQALSQELGQLPPASLMSASSQDPGEELAAHAEVIAAFAQLSDHDREALSLVLWEELSPQRAAWAMSCSPAAFAVRLHRARRRFAQALKIVRARASEQEVQAQ
jgi:RNA polymerase sigma-70 factor (ECF subfamily)